MARPTLEQQQIRYNKIQENAQLVEFKFKLCRRLHIAILKAREKPENERYKYLEDFINFTIEKMY